LHIGVDFSSFDDPGLMRKYLTLLGNEFNRQDYKLLGRDIEVYFQDVTEPHDTPGIYDIENGHWLKVPDGIKIEITEQATKAAESYRIEVADLVANYEYTPKTEASYELEKLLAYWKNIRLMRKAGLEAEGRASFGNLVFKLLRRNGTLETLVDLIRKVRDDVYEVYR